MTSAVPAQLTPPLLLLSGLLCDASIWDAQRAALADIAGVHVLDFPGIDSVQQMAAQTLAAAPDQFALAGHSMGGRVALEIVRQAPERVQRLALLDTGVHPAHAQEHAQRGALVELARRDGMQVLARQWLPPMLHPDRHDDAELMDALMAMVMRQTPQSYAAQVTALLNRPDAAPVLAQVQCPTLLGVGRQDSWSPLERHQDMARQIPHAQLVVFEHSGHMTPVEAPAAVSAALRDWLAA
ncbi:alpha/beta fold hydrolase [Xanthomonas campestris]|uniref:alpha/beta fold hydrolase n=1 Tax=Xanthomonas campestris TaxID=339 RepID=UPI000E1E43C5|nr:alpha/beta hydrolase [Xanthomonas campestris]